MTKEQETDFCHILQRGRGERGIHSNPISHCIIHPETTSVDGFHHHRLLLLLTSIPMHLQHTPNYNINHHCTARFSISELNSIHHVSTWTAEASVGLLLLLVSPNAPSATEDDHDVPHSTFAIAKFNTRGSHYCHKGPLPPPHVSLQMTDHEYRIMIRREFQIGLA